MQAFILTFSRFGWAPLVAGGVDAAERFSQRCGCQSRTLHYASSKKVDYSGADVARRDDIDVTNNKSLRRRVLGPGP